MQNEWRYKVFTQILLTSTSSSFNEECVENARPIQIEPKIFPLRCVEAFSISVQFGLSVRWKIAQFCEHSNRQSTDCGANTNYVSKIKRIVL